MSLNKRVYIVRKYYAQNYGSKSIFEEAVFESYESAYQYIEEISEEDHDRFLSEIVSYIVNDREPWKNEESWTFDRKANLIRYYDAHKKYENCHVVENEGYKTIYYEPKPDTFTYKFEVGDIVIVRAYPWNNDSSMPEDTIGVISWTPIPFDEWIRKGENKYEWENAYVIYFIRGGYLHHMHIEEKHIKLYDKELPENICFLKILSDHFKGNIKLNEEIFKDIVNEKIFVEKVRQFFKEESITT